MVSRTVTCMVLLSLSILVAGCSQHQTTATVPGPFVVTSMPSPAAAPTSGAPAAPAPGVLGQRTKTTGCTRQAGLPDPACTPGAIDPRVTQATLATTICSRGYTATVRPPLNVTEKIKREQMAAYGLQGQRLGDFELDHLVGLELGGAPADAANLWPEPWVGEGNAHEKDATENFLHREVCRGAMQLVEAQRQIATNWLAVYRSHGLQPTP